MNSLRDNVKDAIRESLETSCYAVVNQDKINEDSCEIADAVFSAMGINETDQNKEEVAIVINPSVIVQVCGGIIDLVNATEGVKVDMRDYDLDGCTDHELEEDGCEVVHDETGRYVKR